MITLIEDDKGLSDALIGLFETNNLEAEHFISGEAFLESFDKTTKTNKEKIFQRYRQEYIYSTLD